ncbi:hypothetical protein ABZT03_07045 [Streptomyces sp. NPDC005574]|uniref:hypothetical protein n=1 Tax=Streptomyces sp. NPDC005574 TaxID=3156891 RepID=UPI0033BAD4B2
MARETDHIESVRALRQLRRIRTFYAGGAVLWAASAALTGWDNPGSRPMWVSAILLTVFISLLTVTSVWLWRRQAARTGAPVHHAAPRRMGWRGHANA